MGNITSNPEDSGQNQSSSSKHGDESDEHLHTFSS
mgnify:FL=1